MTRRSKETVRVIAQEKIAHDIYSICLFREENWEAAQAGQFLALYTKDSGKLMPRPISICETDLKERMLRMVYRVTGSHTGTAQFSRLKEGDTLDILGPLGNGFPLKQGKKALLIGGGIGVPPLLELSRRLQGEKQIVVGYRDELFLTEELSKYGQVSIATEDGSSGIKGNVMDVLSERKQEAEVIYACGPTPMLRAVKAYASANQILCYLSLEERMACGIGACLGCVCQTEEIDSHSHVKNKRICKDGPVFLASEVDL